MMISSYVKNVKRSFHYVSITQVPFLGYMDINHILRNYKGVPITVFIFGIGAFAICCAPFKRTHRIG